MTGDEHIGAERIQHHIEQRVREMIAVQTPDIVAGFAMTHVDAAVVYLTGPIQRQVL